MTRIELAPEGLDDFDRFLNDMAEHEVAGGAERLREILDAIRAAMWPPSTRCSCWR